MRRHQLTARALRPLARLFGALARVCEEAERRLNRCPDCGRSRFYGACVIEEREARLRRIGARYPEAEAEARRAGQR